MTAPRNRQLSLGAALVLTLAATLWLAVGDEAENHNGARPVAGNSRAPVLNAGASARSSANTTAAARAETRADATAPLDWAPVARPAWGLRAGDGQFAAWQPPPPPPAPKFAAPPPPSPSPSPPPPSPPPPATVQAPPFPYQLIGRLVEGGQAQILLAGPSSTLAVRVGDVVDGQWRIDQIQEGGLNLTWLPAKLNQTIGFRPNS